MGLFDFFKKKKHIDKAPAPAPSATSSAHLSVRVIGPQEMSEDEYQAMRQENIDYLESKYDFSTVAGIQAIPEPSEEFKNEELKRDFTGRVEYYLLSKAEQYKKAGQTDLALACFRKAVDHMPMYGDFYSREQFMRLPRYLRQLRRFDEARSEEAKIQRLFHGGYQFINEYRWPEMRKQELIMLLSRTQSDLVEIPYIRCCCERCAKYRGRIYSYSGKDTRFPQLPISLLDQHHNCGLQLSLFIPGTSTLGSANSSQKSMPEIIAYSNRPFVDDRTLEELSIWDNHEKERLREDIKKAARDDYDWLWEFMPETCPKSFSAYMRMRNAGTERFLRIASDAATRGRVLK